MNCSRGWLVSLGLSSCRASLLRSRWTVHTAHREPSLTWCNGGIPPTFSSIVFTVSRSLSSAILRSNELMHATLLCTCITRRQPPVSCFYLWGIHLPSTCPRPMLCFRSDLPTYSSRHYVCRWDGLSSCHITPFGHIPGYHHIFSGT
ncbi:hypothetical protein F4859DRAFT_387047 [Xylaria cf. heliscus]|nr:hypothetical protein F4859DRAFT_387047 [Xylaria cf. heliscus]